MFAIDDETEDVLERVLFTDPRLAEHPDALDVAAWVAFVEPDNVPPDTDFRVRHEGDRVVVEFREEGRWVPSPPIPAHDLAFLGRVKWG